jgi:hypothetical protein
MRDGVLSDLAIKSAYPEYQAPNLGLANALDMVVMDKHEFTGIKLPKDIKRKKVSRFPINDIANLASLSGVDNKAKAVYASTQGYRKKLGSSNYDLEDRQYKLKELDKRMGTNFSENQELKRRGGFVDIINSKATISQEQLVSNLQKNKNSNVLQLNKNIRTSTLGLQRVETQLNSALLSNLESAKENSIKQNSLIAQDEKFRRLSGGEVYYNALTRRHYYERRALPDGRTAALREGEVEKTKKLVYSISDKEKLDQVLKLAGARDAEEYEKMTGIVLDENYVVTSTEDFIVAKNKPQYNEYDTPVSEQRRLELENLPDDPTMDRNRKPLTAKEGPMQTPSKRTMDDPDIKNLPKDVEGNIDITEYIRGRELGKLTKRNAHFSYLREELKEQDKIAKLTSQKVIDRRTMAPALFAEKYGSQVKEFEQVEVDRSNLDDLSSLTKLGAGLATARQKIRENYSEISKAQAEDEYNLNEQLFENFEQATQLNITTHDIDPFQN